jgi:hypothetical protein
VRAKLLFLNWLPVPTAVRELPRVGKLYERQYDLGIYLIDSNHLAHRLQATSKFPSEVMMRPLGITLAILALLVVSSPATASPIFPNVLSTNTTGFADSIFTGVPDDIVQGLSTNYLIYDLGTLRINNITGVDINVYEYDVFTSEFAFVDILISSDGVTFTSIKPTQTNLVRITGDGAHAGGNFAKSYDIGPSGLTNIRYIKLQGLGNNGSPCCLRQGFDLDAIGIHSATPADVPEPSTLYLVGTSLSLALAGWRLTSKVRR